MRIDVYDVSSNDYSYKSNGVNMCDVLLGSFRLIRGQDTMCRPYNTHIETAANVLNYCPSNRYAAKRKHNGLLDIMRRNEC